MAAVCVAVGAASVGIGAAGCGQKGGDQPIDRLMPALTKCQQERDRLQEDINALKIKLAQALANPGTIKVDPSVLAIEGRPSVQQAQEGTLTQNEVISVLRRSKGSLQACYTRALKRNSALHHESITLTVAFKVNNDGRPSGISIRPTHDRLMIDCMNKAIGRWTFPRFKGQPVGVESPVTLTPKQ